MNNAPLTLILIASLGIVAVISLGVFFAVRPKFAGTEEHLAADVSDQKQLYSSGEPIEGFVLAIRGRSIIMFCFSITTATASSSISNNFFSPIDR